MGLSLKTNKCERKYWVCAILLFIISFPKFVWGMGADVMLMAQFLLFVVCYNDIINNKKSTACIFAFLLQVIFVCIHFTDETTNISGYLKAIVQGLSFVTIFFCSPKFWRSCIDCFIRLLALLLVFALIEHILVCFFDINSHSTMIEECPINKGRSYVSYFFNVYLEVSFSHFSRFFAFYDEPGVLGNIAMVLLYLQKFDLKKWYNVVLLISGILTFSLAFYFAICAFYLITSGSIKKIIVFGAVLAVLIFWSTDNEYIEYYVFRRVQFVDGTLVGYNRERANFNVFFEQLKIKDYIFFGYTPRSQIEYAASWKWALVLYGVIPSILYFLLCQLRNWRSILRKEDVLNAVILAVIIWIQRPFIHLYLYALLFVIPSVYYQACEEDNHTELA